MEWLAQNWFFVLLLAAFVAMHLFGHGGHGGRGGHGAHGGGSPSRGRGGTDPRDWDPGVARRPSDRDADTGHRHSGS